MTTYFVTGKAYRKKGKAFPFRKVVEAADQSQAKHELARWLRANKLKLQTSTFKLMEAGAESKPKQEGSEAKPEILLKGFEESVWRHVSEQGWPGFQDVVKALINVCEKIQTFPLETDQVRAVTLCRKLEELPIAA